MGKRKGIQKARLLRRESTDAEERLWYHLRNRRLGGYKFRRQHPVEPYFLDFFCAEESLAVEVDGGGHGYADNLRHDAKRDAFLQSLGVRVIRFKNREVREEIDSQASHRME